MTIKDNKETNSNARNRHSRWGECRYRLKGLLAEHSHFDHNGIKRISYATWRERSKILLQGFRYLHEVGMGLRKPQNFATRHARVLIAHWEEQKLAAATLQLRFSVFKTFCGWIGKKGMLGNIDQYLSDPGIAKRHYVAREDKSWSAKGVDVKAKINEVAQIDKRLAAALKLMYAFGLRIREAVTLHPVSAHQKTCLVIEHGTKGGRPRVIPIDYPWQHEILEEAKGYANRSTGSLIPDNYKRDSWLKRAYIVFGRCGISRKDGITPHGLRHQRANDLYEETTGEESPARGGPVPIDKLTDDNARLTVAKYLGHSRKQISGAYLGPIVKRKNWNESE